MTLINHVLHTNRAEAHAHSAVVGLRAAGHQAGSLLCDRLTINALRGMPAVIMIVGPSQKSAFLDALASAPSLRLRSTLFAVRTLDDRLSATAQRLVSHFYRHGGRPVGSTKLATLPFEEWIHVIADTLPRPRRSTMAY